MNRLHSRFGRVTTSVVIACWLGGSGCGNKTQPPPAAGTNAAAPATTPDSSASRADSSHISQVPAPATRAGAVAGTPAKTDVPQAARPAKPTGSAVQHPAVTAPPKPTGASTPPPATEPAPVPAPSPAPVPVAAAPPASGTAAAGGLDDGPRAADTPVDPALASRGKNLFTQKACSTCHKMDGRLIGPPLGPVPRQRTAAWIMAMIQRPSEMTRTDPIARQLLQEYKVQMVPLGTVSAEEARALLEYIKSAAR